MKLQACYISESLHSSPNSSPPLFIGFLGTLVKGEEFLGVCLRIPFTPQAINYLIHCNILLTSKDSLLSSKPTANCFPMIEVLLSNRNSAVFGLQDSLLLTGKLRLRTENPEIQAQVQLHKETDSTVQESRKFMAILKILPIF